MTRSGLLASLAAASLTAAASAAEPNQRLYELRVYYAAEGKLDALHARFRDHTMRLFEKHGMTNEGYWVPADENKENRLIYVLSYPSAEARKKSWEGFIADPEWKKAHKESELQGKLVAKIESTLLTPTDYSPKVKLEKANPQRVFELRTYTTPAGRLDDLHARFRDHTMKLFEKHGMTNLWYWTPTAGQKNAEVTLIYFLAHQSVEARNKSFGEFRKDPAWEAARTASEKKAGGSLTTPDGVKFVLLKPTDYSPIK